MCSQHTPDDVSTVRVLWTDINGIARGITLPADQYEHAIDEGIGFANGVMELTLEPGLLDDPKYGPQSGDMLAVPDQASLMRVGWSEETAVVCSDLRTVDGEPFDVCGRSVLRRVVDELTNEGLVPRVGVEPEFSLLAPDGEGGWEPYNSRSSYDFDALDQSRDLISTWTRAMSTAGYKLLGIHQESQPGQYEVNIRYDDAVSMADGFVFFRQMIRSTARNAGFRTTFMPRPYTDEDANGLHFHISLWDDDLSTNRFSSTEDDITFPAGKHPETAGVSDVGRHFVGGVLEHMKPLTAICAPTINSYKRLLPGIWAPVNIAWGPDNRSTVVRLPPELGDSTRIEQRVTDTSANPYLALAATLAAGFNGIRNEIDPGEPTMKNAYHEPYERLPRTLPEALNHLEQCDVLTDALGDSLVTEFIKLKRDEFDRYQNYVTEWELNEYRDEF